MFSKKRVNFLVIGAQKCGTSSFYRYLTENPEIEAATRKELHYFDIFYDRGRKWYHRNFRFSKETITGESTPFYLLHPHAPERVQKYNPVIKLIVLLRNPVERAVSHYRMNVANGKEALSFSEAIRKEEDRLAGHQNLSDPQSPLLLYSYKKRGRYAGQLAKWYALFPREQILLINYHDFFLEPWKNIQAVYDFLDVAPYFGSTDVFKENVSSLAEEVSQEDIQYLQQYFEEPNKQLAQQHHIRFE